MFLRRLLSPFHPRYTYPTTTLHSPGPDIVLIYGFLSYYYIIILLEKMPAQAT